MIRISKKSDIFSQSLPKNEQESSSELTDSYEHNTNMIKNILNKDAMVVFRESNKNKKICIIYYNGMVNTNILSETIIAPIINASIDRRSPKSMIDTISQDVISVSDYSKTARIGDIIDAVLGGDTVLLAEDCNQALIISSQGFEMRAIEEPSNEKNIRGPKEGFAENYIVNISLLRRKIKNPDLKFLLKAVGTRTRTTICVCYMEALSNEKILDELLHRIDSIDIDGILDSGYIQELIKDSPLSPFSTVGYSEKPDKIVANLLEGRIAIIVDGSPAVLTVPFVFSEYFQSSEDYYNDFWFGSFNRFLRYFSFFLSSCVTALYVTVTAFHHEMIPSPLLLSISAAREGLPFPTTLEAVAMILMFTILREIGIRMPTSMGSTLGFVGAIVLGQAAVSARFISAPMVIIVGLTSISSYILPKMIMPLNIIRFILLIASAFLGIYGFMMSIIAVIIYLASLRSFGVPYLLTYGSLKSQDIKDTTIRYPLWYMKYRPKIIGAKNRIRVQGEK